MTFFKCPRMPANFYESLCSSLEQFKRKKNQKNLHVRQEKVISSWLSNSSITQALFLSFMTVPCLSAVVMDEKKILFPTFWLEGCCLTLFSPLVLSYTLLQEQVILHEQNGKSGKMSRWQIKKKKYVNHQSVGTS